MGDVPALFTEPTAILLVGFMAFFGGIAGHFVLHLLQRNRTRREVLREKGELLIELVYENADWLHGLERKYLFSNSVGYYEQKQPLPQAQMLQKLYFPKFTEYFYAIKKADITYVNWINTSAALISSASPSVSVNYEKGTDYYDAYYDAVSTLTEAMSIEIQEHLDTPSIPEKLRRFTERLHDWPG